MQCPRKTIPRSILISIGVVGLLYLAMNISILGVVPWREAMHSDAIVADFMRRIYGIAGARIVSVLILIATFGSVFAVLLSYSRVPFAAAADGRFFSVFARVHSKGHYPIVAVLTMGLLSALACVFSLAELINTLIVVQTMQQFNAQCVAAVFLLRRGFHNNPLSYRIPLFPLPALVALGGWIYIVVTSGTRYIGIGALLIVDRRSCIPVALISGSGMAFWWGMNIAWDVAVAGEIFADHVFSGFARWPQPGEELFTDSYVREVGGGAAITACGLTRLGRRYALSCSCGPRRRMDRGPACCSTVSS